MATVPSTILLKSTNLFEFPTEYLIVIVKQIFRYGVKSIERKGDQIMLKLSYSPKGETMIRKLGNLPVQYIRLAIETDRELEILKRCMKRYTFDINDDEQAKALQIENAECNAATTMKRSLVEEGESSNSRGNNKKVKVLENRLIQPPPTLATLVEMYDIDADEFESQKFSCVDVNQA